MNSSDSILTAIGKLEGNKSTATALGNSNILYPTQNAVKSYVDNHIVNITYATSNITLNDTFSGVFCDATSGAITVTLPTPGTANIGKIYVLRKMDESSNAVNFTPQLYLTISNTVSSLNYPKTIRVRSNGSYWFILD